MGAENPGDTAAATSGSPQQLRNWVPVDPAALRAQRPGGGGAAVRRCVGGSGPPLFLNF